MNTFSHSHYESITFRNDGSGILDTNGYRIRVKMRIPEQKKVRWNELFSRNKSGGSQTLTRAA